MADEEQNADIVPKVTNEYGLPAEWKMNEAGAAALMAAKAMSTNKHSFYASIPIICHGESCPYYSTCGIQAIGMDVNEIEGQRCPIEIQYVVNMFNAYQKELNIEPDAIIDLTLVKELVDLDVMIRRAELKMAQEGDFAQDVAVGVTEKGRVIMRPELTKTVEFKEKMLRRRHEILQLLNSTRKDKAGSKLTVTMDPSSYAADLLAKFEASYEVKDDDTEAGPDQ